MKKFLKAMLAAMLIAITAVTVCSCGVPSDPAKAKENLTKNNYTVSEVAATTGVKAITTLNTVYLSLIKLKRLYGLRTPMVKLF